MTKPETPEDLLNSRKRLSKRILDQTMTTPETTEDLLNSLKNYQNAY